MKKHIVLISVGVLNVLHGSFHIIQFIQSMFFVAYATHEHTHDEGFIEQVMHHPIFALLMGIIGILTLVIGIKDYRHHKKCETEPHHHEHKPLNVLEDNAISVETKVRYKIGDLDHEMWNPKQPTTFAEAMEICDKEYTNRNKGNEHDEYWQKRRTGIWKVTETKELLYDNKNPK